MIYGSSLSFALMFTVIFLITTIPFSLKAFKQDIIFGVLSPFFLLLRAAAQFMGVTGGIIYIARKTLPGSE